MQSNEITAVGRVEDEMLQRERAVMVKAFQRFLQAQLPQMQRHALGFRESDLSYTKHPCEPEGVIMISHINENEHVRPRGTHSITMTIYLREHACVLVLAWSKGVATCKFRKQY